MGVRESISERYSCQESRFNCLIILWALTWVRQTSSKLSGDGLHRYTRSARFLKGLPRLQSSVNHCLSIRGTALDFGMHSDAVSISWSENYWVASTASSLSPHIAANQDKSALSELKLGREEETGSSRVRIVGKWIKDRTHVLTATSGWSRVPAGDCPVAFHHITCCHLIS